MTVKTVAKVETKKRKNSSNIINVLTVKVSLVWMRWPILKTSFRKAI